MTIFPGVARSGTQEYRLDTKAKLIATATPSPRAHLGMGGRSQQPIQVRSQLYAWSRCGWLERCARRAIPPFMLTVIPRSAWPFVLFGWIATRLIWVLRWRGLDVEFSWGTLTASAAASWRPALGLAGCQRQPGAVVRSGRDRGAAAVVLIHGGGCGEVSAKGFHARFAGAGGGGWNGDERIRCGGADGHGGTAGPGGVPSRKEFSCICDG